MKEKIYTKKKNGMLALLLTLLLLIAGVASIVGGAFLLDDGRAAGGFLLAFGIVTSVVGWLPFCGMKVLKPQEALVLTLFGDYKGTIREQGFYFVNPFCTAVNPAAGTKLAQSGDTQSAVVSPTEKAMEMQLSGKRISLKAMTLNNGRQKINDCLGNPVEIGIAVIWRVTDTAKAVFNVDNYKEYLSH